jgi:methanogenic corrinoid protein MtbC1
MNEQERNLVEWLADMREEEAVALASRLLFEEGADPMRVLELCRAAMDVVGKRFETGEYFLPELVLAGEMLENIHHSSFGSGSPSKSSFASGSFGVTPMPSSRA